MRFLMVESVCNIIFFGVSFLYSLYQVSRGDISIGHFVMISSYILMLSSPLESIGSMYTALQKSTASLYIFINNLSDMTAVQESDSDLITPVEFVKIRGLHFFMKKQLSP
ncbi:Uncharacterised protein [Serratia quinivorans]|nr:Uncharacterised protein [Serratia quinivorans]CAI1947523.1 Uncharacterised protein [Serratia quinivorans]